MSQPAAFSQRLAAFKENFKNLVTRKHAGYDELAGLERPLVGGEESERDDSYAGRHGVSGPGTYQGPMPGYEGGAQYGQGVQQSMRPTQPRTGSTTQSYIPKQGEELRQLAGLSKDAAELLWEMAVMADSGEAVSEMLEKAKLLQAQLRGMIGDFSDTDEAALASGLEAFDVLNRSLEEYETVSSPTAASGAAHTTHTNSAASTFALAPPPGHPAPAAAPAATPAFDNERPLIEF